ncbi:lysophospholipid acyltransferase family protein [Microbispora sp. NPDC049125]|uniref:lysophospholipid acyltransferase family protein n=1 Tax=Microbispora sp. NPDC049125 TaxID=3154929 RepID=UPI0034660FB2
MSTVVHLPVPISAWLPTSPCAPASCVDAPVATVGPLRRSLRLLGALTVLLAGVPLALCARWAGPARRSRLTMTWSRLLVRALGVKIETHRGFSVVGGSVAARSVPDDGGPMLLVANHMSWLDPVLVAAITPCRPLAKSEVGRWPVVRTLAAGGRALFIDRDRLSALPGAIAEVADALRAGDSVAAFPEGTTWCGREMGQFRPAVFQAAIDAGVPVRPLTVRFLQGEALSTAPAYVGEDTLLASILRVTGISGLVAEVTLFPGVRLADASRPYEARRALARITEAQVRTGLLEYRQESVAA